MTNITRKPTEVSAWRAVANAIADAMPDLTDLTLGELGEITDAAIAAYESAKRAEKQDDEVEAVEELMAIASNLTLVAAKLAPPRSTNQDERRVK